MAPQKQTLAGPKKKTRSRKQDMMKNKSPGDSEKMAERQRSKASFLKEQLAQQMRMAELLKNPDTAALGKQMVRDQKKIRQGAYLAHKTQLARAEASDKANQERLEQEKEMQRKWLQTRQVERAATAGLDLNQEPFVRERENLEESLKSMTMESAAAETPEMEDVL